MKKMKIRYFTARITFALLAVLLLITAAQCAENNVPVLVAVLAYIACGMLMNTCWCEGTWSKREAERCKMVIEEWERYRESLIQRAKQREEA